MRSIPHWLIMALKKDGFQCPFCRYKFEENNISAIGIRESIRKTNKEILFIEYSCNRCKKKADIEFEEMEFEEVIRDLFGEGVNMDYDETLEEIEEKEKFLNKKMKNNNKTSKQINKKSKMTVKEVKDFIKNLYSIKNNEDFLLEIGLTQEEIDKYIKENNNK